MSDEIELARIQWMKERAAFEAFAEVIATKQRSLVQAQGIWCDVTFRAKEPHSLIRKLLKGKHTYDTLTDKAGVRCVVRYRSEIEHIIALSKEAFACSDPDRKEEALATDRVGYVSTHLDVTLRADDTEASKYPTSQYHAELQIRTLGQHLWAEMSHDSVYKYDEMLTALPVDVRRRVNLMSGLIEVADREFDRLDGELQLSTELQIYKALERQYFKLAAKRPDPQLSLEVIGLLFPLYQLEPLGVVHLIDDFFASHEATLHAVFASTEESRASAFFYQPEVLLIYERLEADPVRVRQTWNAKFPETELEKIANAFGISFD